MVNAGSICSLAPDAAEARLWKFEVRRVKFEKHAVTLHNSNFRLQTFEYLARESNPV